MKIGKYFDDKELACKCCGAVDVNVELINRLDALREFYGKPLHITSGYRCSKHNAEVGGVNDSAHMHGIAVDVTAGSPEKYELLGVIFQTKLFNRIGIAKNFIHLDIDTEKPQRVIWTY